MAIEIKGAPAPGWYFPCGPSASSMAPRLWTGLARFRGRHVEGLIISIFKYDGGSRVMPNWLSATTVRGLSRMPAAYKCLDVLPDMWRDQDIGDAGRMALQIAEEHRALIEQRAIRDATH